jgi:hypothetical protein
MRLMPPNPYPLTTAWYQRLYPAGLDAFPTCTASTRLPRSIAADYPDLPRLPGLMPQWRQALAVPMQQGGWMPETTLVLQYLLLRDAYFDDDAAFFAATKQRIKASFAHPAIRPLMALMSPHLLMLGASRRWAAYHLGSALTVTAPAAGRLLATLTFPPGLYPPLMIEDTKVAIEASIEMTNKRITALSATLTAPGVCTIEGAWD